MNETYILQKDIVTPNHVRKAGAEYKKYNGKSYYCGNNFISAGTVKNNPDWFKLKELPPDYEIIYFRNKTHLTIVTAPENKLAISDLLKSHNLEIYSVKRLSDGEVFNIGDETNNGIIEQFETMDGIMFVHCKNRNMYFYLSQLQKVKPKQQTFTESELVSFGNYLLSDKRKECFHAGSYAELMERLNRVHDNDLTTWQNEINNMDVE